MGDFKNLFIKIPRIRSGLKSSDSLDSSRSSDSVSYGFRSPHEDLKYQTSHSEEKSRISDLNFQNPYNVLINSNSVKGVESQRLPNAQDLAETNKFMRDNNHDHTLTKGVKSIQKNIIGDGHVFQGPFGPRKCLYLDQTASGRCLKGIESFMMDTVMPIYGNTHSTTTYTASQVTAYRDESRKLIKKYCGGEDDDELIFCGSGATAAIHKLLGSLLLQGEVPPVVILGPFEHHSNILPWREVTNEEVIVIRENSRGQVDLKHLEKVLKSLKSGNVFNKRLVLGSFSAGSNVTGVLSDDVAITSLLHKYGALSIWDYAAAAPHSIIQMNPNTGNEHLDKLARKDAIFFSGHKFVGGPQTPGVLLAKRHMFRNYVPHGQGGGTVVFVTNKRHQYIQDAVERSEGGTPDILGSIRLGLVFQVQRNIGLGTIASRENHFTQMALDAWGKLPEIKILGQTDSMRLPIISLMIQHLQTGYFLHHDFIVSLLNAIFGIQCRGGCMCAGPYAQNLLGISDNLALKYERVLKEPRIQPEVFVGEAVYDVILKPGFVRMSLPYHASDKEIRFAIDAISFLAKNAWKLLPFYKMDAAKGTFRFSENHASDERKNRSIKSFTVEEFNQTSASLLEEFSRLNQNYIHPDFEACLKYAENISSSAEKVVSTHAFSCVEDEDLPPDRVALRWFLLPSEAICCLRSSNRKSSIRSSKPFSPKECYKTTVSSSPFLAGSIPYKLREIARSQTP